MCTASTQATKTRDATHTDEDDLKLVTDLFGQPYFHRTRDDIELVTCIKHGARVTISGLSEKICKQLNLSEQFSGTFAQDKSGKADAVLREDGKFVSLNELVMYGDKPSVELVQSLTCEHNRPFISACTHYFAGDRPEVTDAWGVWFEQVDVWQQPLPIQCDGDPNRLNVDSLPAAFLADGTVLNLHQTTEPALEDIGLQGTRPSTAPNQAKHLLTDA